MEGDICTPGKAGVPRRWLTTCIPGADISTSGSPRPPAVCIVQRRRHHSKLLNQQAPYSTGCAAKPATCVEDLPPDVPWGNRLAHTFCATLECAKLPCSSLTVVNLPTQFLSIYFNSPNFCNRKIQLTGAFKICSHQLNVRGPRRTELEMKCAFQQAGRARDDLGPDIS